MKISRTLRVGLVILVLIAVGTAAAIMLRVTTVATPLLLVSPRYQEIWAAIELVKHDRGGMCIAYSTADQGKQRRSRHRFRPTRMSAHNSTRGFDRHLSEGSLPQIKDALRLSMPFSTSGLYMKGTWEIIELVDD